jgi:threonine 3-dehydrogenase
MSRMKAPLKEAAAPGLKLVEIDIPKAGPREILVRVLATSVCGTDLHIFKWDAWAQSQMTPPVVVGHEFCGEIVETGPGVTRFRTGDRVAVESHVPCDACHQCENGRRHICDNLKIIGVHRDGSFAQFISVPEVCAWKHPAGLAPEIATLMEPMGNAVHAVSAAKVKGKQVAVFGCGPAGLFAINCAKAMDAAAIYAIDVNENRLALAKKMGASELFKGNDPDLAATLAKRGGGHGLDVAFEMSGHTTAVNNAFKSLKKGATFVAFGIPPRPIELDWGNEVILKGRTVLGIVGRLMFETWEQMQKLLDSGRLDPRPAITHRYKLEDFQVAFDTLQLPESPAAKIVLTP